MNPKAKFTFSINDAVEIGSARLIITRRRKLDFKPTGTGPKASKDVVHQEVLQRSMQWAYYATEHRYECSVEIGHNVLKRLWQRNDSDLTAEGSTKKNILCMCFVVTNTDGEIIAKVSRLITA
jgi:hypothetical protein